MSLKGKLIGLTLLVAALRWGKQGWRWWRRLSLIGRWRETEVMSKKWRDEMADDAQATKRTEERR